MGKNKVRSKNRKIHPTKKPIKKIEKKRSKKIPEQAVPHTIQEDSSSPIESDPDYSNTEDLLKLLEPYSKSHLIDFITESALKDSALFNQIRDTADRDVSHRKIFVHGLSYDTTSATLLAVFKPFGEIEECVVVTDRVTGKAKGFGFVMFKTRRAASKALMEPRKTIGNRVAMCQLASIGPPLTPQAGDNSSRKIYVSNVHIGIKSQKLRSLFERFGEIEMGPLGFDTQTGKSRGFALFVYATQEGAKKALEEPFKMLEGHRLHCQMAFDGKSKVPMTSTVFTQNLGMIGALANNQSARLMMAPGALSSPGLIHTGQLGGGSLAQYSGIGSLGGGSSILGTLNTPGMIPSGQLGQIGTGSLGLGGYNISGVGFSSLGGSSSGIGFFGSSAPTMGLHNVYQNSQLGLPSSSGSHISGGSLGGYRPYM